MKRLIHPGMWMVVVGLAVIVVAAAVLIPIGYHRIMEGRSWRLGAVSETHAAIPYTTSPDRVIPEEMRAQFEQLGLGDVPDHILATLSSLEKVDDYPIYTMHYYGPYIRAADLAEQYGLDLGAPIDPASLAWGCSLFGAVGDLDWPVMGRNFDWEYSPILVVFLEPEDGYSSVMSVDLSYLVSEDKIGWLDECTADELLPLLSAPFLTFDGMNEMGLAIGMASVDYECGYPTDPNHRSVGDLYLMREILEACATVEEALVFLDSVNPTSQGGPNMHYLLTDTTPSAVLIEYDAGEMHVFRSSDQQPWQLGTNFPVVLANDDPAGICWRYDSLVQSLREQGGDLSSSDALALLQQVSTPTTQWSIAYDLTKRIAYLAVGRRFDVIFRASLETGKVILEPNSRGAH